MAVKSTNSEVEIRIFEVLELIIRGYTRDKIVRYGSKKWKVSSRTIDEYLARSKEKIKESYSDEYKKSLIDVHLFQLDDLYQKNYEEEDFRECRNIIESKNKMLGLNAAEKIQTEITNKPKKLIIKINRRNEDYET